MTMTQEQSQFIENVQYAIFGLGMANMMCLCSLVILEDTTKAIIVTSVIPIVFFIIQFLDKK